MAKYYCKWCGQHYSSIQNMSVLKCTKNPDGSKRHELYEGNEKSKYQCKWCGQSYSSLLSMAQLKCSKNPHHDRHEPLA